MNGYIQVVKRETIPPVQRALLGDEPGPGELRDFRWNDRLREFMPGPSRVSVSWVRLEPGQSLRAQSGAASILLIPYAGAGTLSGDPPAQFGKDDVVVVPTACNYALTAGEDGLHALSIALGDERTTPPEEAPPAEVGEESFAELIEHNRRRVAKFERHPIFDLLTDGTLENERKRAVYLESVQTWVDSAQKLLLVRQASCEDPRYSGTFLSQLREEIGHDILRKQASPPKPPQRRRDAVLEAVSDWFVHQMHVLDNAEKAALVYLVLEHATASYQRRARPALAPFTNSHYFWARIDTEHSLARAQVLRNESVRAHRRMQRVVHEGWDMLEALCDRIVELTRTEA